MTFMFFGTIKTASTGFPLYRQALVYHDIRDWHALCYYLYYCTVTIFLLYSYYTLPFYYTLTILLLYSRAIL